MSLRSDPYNPPSRLIVIFLLLAICIGLAGNLYYSEQKTHIKHNVQDELSAVADLKVGQVVSWRKEQIDDAELIFTSPFISQSISAWRNTAQARQKRELLSWMQSVRTTHRYKALLLLDAQGRVLLASPAEQGTVGPDGKRLAQEAGIAKKIILSDLYQSKIVPETRCSVVVPILKRADAGDQNAVAVLLIRIDLSEFLFPLIRSWPGMSKSAETLLLRRERDEVVLLNEARHMKNTALSLRAPLAKKPELAALLNRGEKGVIELRDYRDVPAIAAIQPVPGTSWFLVSKVDQDEIYAPLRRQAALLTVVVFVLITAAGISIYFWWRRQIAEHLHRQYASELALKSMTTRYDYVSKYANDIILLSDQSGRIIEANDRAAAVYGYTRDELLQLALRDILPAEIKEEASARMNEVDARSGLIFESLHRRKDGTVFPVEVSSCVVDVGTGKFYQNIIRDTTERKLTENKIRHSARLYAFLSQVNQTIVRADDRNRLFKDICRIAVDFGGFRLAWIGLVDDGNGRGVVPIAGWGAEDGSLTNIDNAAGLGLQPGSDVIREGKHFVCNDIGDEPHGGPWRDRARRRGYRSSGAFPVKLRDSVIGSLNVFSDEPVFFSTEEIKLLDEVALDISFALDNMEREKQRREADVALKARTDFIEAILNNLPLGLAVNRVGDGGVLYLNEAFEKIYGWPRDVLVNVEEFFRHVYPDPAYREEIRARVLADMATGDPGRMHWENIDITTRTGDKRRITAINIPLLDQDIMISTVQDVTQRRQAEQALIEGEHRFKRLVESVTDYIYTVQTEHGSVVSTSHGPSCVSVTGYLSEEYDADPGLWLRMVFEEDRDLVLQQSRRILSGEPVAPFEHRLIHKDGSLHWVRNTPVPRHDQDGRLIAYDGLITDITMIKTLENQLRQAQKMEAVGQLAGGVAHDFNNILTAIIGYANLLLMKLPQGDSGRSFVDQILSSAERAGHLTHSLLTFSRKQIIDLKPVNLNEIIRRVERLLARVIGEDIDFRTGLSSAELVILADSIQIEQILMNLATNARDAMPDGGMLRIETEALELGEDFVRGHSYAKPGRYALISVTDTGVGMDDAVKPRIFEPFFTTKAMGKGTGLGLAMVYGIVKQHNGYIHVYSELAHGSTFKIYFPRIESSASAAVETKPVTITGGNETVLLAEDDGSVRAMTKKVLEDFGYRVIESSDGEEAVQKFKENRGRVHLLIMDIIMPRKNGKEAYEEIKAMQPDIKALFTSGYTADIVQQKGIMEAGLAFVGKPSSPTVLLQKVREILEKQ